MRTAITSTTADYPVLSDADDWANFPNLTGRQTVVNASTWGGTQRGFLIWWLGRFPRTQGSLTACRQTVAIRLPGCARQAHRLRSSAPASVTAAGR